MSSPDNKKIEKVRNPDKIRSIAIIAHIDHGKTTLLDGLLKQSHVFRDNQVIEERVMDSYDQEKERGITIFAKHTSVEYKDYKINIIDTPGHADFSGEVERVLGMVDTVLLIVDAKEGPMPQTRFVLSKSLRMGLCPIVVLNKIDRPHANPERVLDATFDLFVELGANDQQLDFKYCYASGLKGYAYLDLNHPQEDFHELFELVLTVPPRLHGTLEQPFLMQVSTIGYDDYVGRQACGRILQGTVRKGKTLAHVDREGKQTNVPVTRIEGHYGLIKVEMEEAGAGDIVLISGVQDVMIGDTLCDSQNVKALPPIKLDEPTVAIEIWVNNGPFVGKSGKHVTLNKIRDRLMKEKRANISYHITSYDEKITVAGRGELHLAILLEAMRREGFEFCVSKPQVILKEVDGQKQEPIDRVHIEVPEEYSGSVIEHLSRKRGEMQHLHTDVHGISHIDFLIPTRGLMGYRNDFLTATKGLGILTSIFEHYGPYKGDIPGRPRGVLISMSTGKTSSYSLFSLQERGELFVGAGEDVYEGMIVGEHSRDNDLVVNPTKAKQLTNVRAAGKDENLILSPPRQFCLEDAITYIESDEWIEATPDSIRLRKIALSEVERKRSGK